MDLIEKVAREICFNSYYADYGADELEEVTCQQCASPDECTDWNVHSFGDKRKAKAAITTVLREMMEPTMPTLCEGLSAVSRAGAESSWDRERSRTRAIVRMFAQQHGIDLGGEDE